MAHGQVQRIALERTATGYRGSAQPFLTGMVNPLPVTTAADGALLVGDWSTGTVYRITG